jgi:hypothetical protein
MKTSLAFARQIGNAALTMAHETRHASRSNRATFRKGIGQSRNHPSSRAHFIVIATESVNDNYHMVWCVLAASDFHFSMASLEVRQKNQERSR